MSWRRREILLATGGRVGREGKTTTYGEVVTDSNKVEKGSVFVALRGERFDGHSFLEDAVHRGAACLVVHKTPKLSRLKKDVTVIQVRNTLQALGELAHYRGKWWHPRF
jgi:UDP-N-acetylmuramyl pentapeptide synthase